MQFKEGLFGTLSLENLIQSHPVEMWSILAVNKDEKLTSEYIQDLFVPYFSSLGSNKRPKEETVLMYLYNFLQECQGLPK